MSRELFPEAPIASMDALFDIDGVAPNPSADVWETLRDAEVITAVDYMTRRERVLYGADLLRVIRASGGRRWVHVLRIGLDFGTDELPRLRAVIAAATQRG